jgi:hypothetical protein
MLEDLPLKTMTKKAIVEHLEECDCPSLKKLRENEIKKNL